MIAVDDVDLANIGTIDVKRSLYMVEMAKGVQNIAGGPAL